MFADEEVYAIEEHRFAPLTRLNWREARPRTDTLDALIEDLECPPDLPALAPAPEAIDLAVLKRLAEDPEIAPTVRLAADVRRFWEVCSLPDFRQHGAETHARFVARLWQDLRRGQLGGDMVASAITQLDNVSGDIDALQGRIAAIRSWSYMAQRPDWIIAKEEMAARARAAEARLSDALHARLTERFVNRRTSVLMRKVGGDSAMLPVELDGDRVLVDAEPIGELRGFRFRVDPATRHGDRKLLLAAADRHVPALIEARANELTATIEQGAAPLSLDGDALMWQASVLARLTPGRSPLAPVIVADPALDGLSPPTRRRLSAALSVWLAAFLEPLAALRRLDEARFGELAGPELRALLIRLVEAGGVLERAGSGIELLDKSQRTKLAKLGVRVGTLDLFVPQMLREGAMRAWCALAAAVPAGSSCAAPPPAGIPPVLPAVGGGRRSPRGYRRLGGQWLRLDIAEKLLREAHEARGHARRGTGFALDPARAVSTGLSTAGYAQLLRLGGFLAKMPRPLAPGRFGPPAPLVWHWRPPARRAPPSPAGTPRLQDNAFAVLAELVR